MGKIMHLKKIMFENLKKDKIWK